MPLIRTAASLNTPSGDEKFRPSPRLKVGPLSLNCSAINDIKILDTVTKAVLGIT